MHLSIKERCDELQQAKEHLSEEFVQRRKDGIANMLKSLVPAGNSEIAAIQDANGEIWTDAENIARVLNEHWQATFDQKATDRALRSKWLEKIRGKCMVDKDRLRPTRAEVREIIVEAPSSAAGPDGIPFVAYRKAVGVATD
eukprot:1042392-Karenia_brevis.AAC.1